MFTNVSGKFASPAISHAATGAFTTDDEPAAVNLVPPCPNPPADNKPAASDYMALVKELFGKLWWLWLVVIFYAITKEN